MHASSTQPATMETARPTHLSGVGATALLTLALIVGGLGYTFWVAPWVAGAGQQWIMAVDAWVPLRGAHYIASGAYPYLYESDPYLVMTPLTPLLLTPIAWLSDVFHLGENIPGINLPRPSAWPLLGVVGLATGGLVLFGADKLVRCIRPRDPQDAVVPVQVCILLIALLPALVVAGHYEDAVALGGMLLSLGAMARRRTRVAAIWLGLAIASKQWAILQVPLLLACTDRRERRTAGLIVLGIPLAFVAPMMIADWSHATAALTRLRAFPRSGHPALWIDRTAREIAGAPFRAVLVPVAIALAWLVRRERSPAIWCAVLAVVFGVRLVLEPVLFSYYLAPALTFLCLFESASRRIPIRTLVLGGALSALFLWHPTPWLWWPVAIAIAIPLFWPAVRAVIPAMRSAGVSDATTARVRSDQLSASSARAAADISSNGGT